MLPGSLLTMPNQTDTRANSMLAAAVDMIAWTLAPVVMVAGLHADPIPVRHRQGCAHGFLEVRNLEGARIATGDVTQVVRGDQATSHVTFRFRDGSIDDEVTVFSQHRVFRLISDHHIQRGPTFPKPIDVFIDAASGVVTSRTEDGKIIKEHMELPSDVSNGLPPNLLLNVLPSAPETRISFVAPTAKPRLIHISIRGAGEAPFQIGDSRRKAVDYVLHAELGGIEGAIAPMIGKQPADYHIWILTGPSPAFIREEGQFFEGGPIWRVELISPTFRR
jgi:hypothetical protein